MSWISTKLFGIRQLLRGGAVLPERPAINFVTGATVTDNPATNCTDVSISASDILTDSTALATPDTIVRRSIVASANFGGTCHFVGVDATGTVSAGAVTCGGALSVGAGASVTGNLSCTGNATVSGTLTSLAVSCSLVTSSGVVKGTSFQLAAAVTETRVQQGAPMADPAEWICQPDGLWKSVGTGARLYITLRLPHGATLNSVSVGIKGGHGDGNLPVNLPQFTLLRWNTSTHAVESLWIQHHTPASIAEYELAHAITGSGMGYVVDTVGYRYYLELKSEAGGSAYAGLEYQHTTVTYTRPKDADVSFD